MPVVPTPSRPGAGLSDAGAERGASSGVGALPTEWDPDRIEWARPDPVLRWRLLGRAGI